MTDESAHPDETPPAARDVAKDCHVCSEPLSPGHTATCNHCHRPFHLRTRQDQDGTDCGEVWINEQYLALEFACFICLGKTATTEPGVGQGH